MRSFGISQTWISYHRLKECSLWEYIFGLAIAWFQFWLKFWYNTGLTNCAQPLIMQLSQLFAYLLRNVDILPTHPKFFYKQRRAKPKSIWQHRYMYAMHIIVERVSSTPYFQGRFSGQIDIHTFHTESRFQSTEKPNSDKPLPKPLIIQQWTSYWMYLKITETLKSTSLWSSLCLALPRHLKSHRWSSSDPNCIYVRTGLRGVEVHCPLAQTRALHRLLLSGSFQQTTDTSFAKILLSVEIHVC